MDDETLPPLPEPTGFLDVGQFRGGLFAHYTADDLRTFALDAVRREREQLSLPKSYGGSTLNTGTWGTQKNGCTLRIHFTDAKEAQAWFARLTDNLDAVRSRSQVEQGKAGR